ncbi:multicopper oxidase family protein [Dictyobacter formicarum]|nr:multicopper oxidase family protein [Dictyobacter formicarum]
MYVSIHFVDDIILFLLLIVWIIAGSQVFLLPRQASSKRQRLGIRRSLFWLGFSELLVLIKLGAVVAKWVLFGWIFAQERMLLDLPLLFLPAFSVLLFSFPFLRRMSRNLPQDGESPAKQDATAPALLVPTLITVVGVVLDTYLTLIYTDPSSLPLILILFALFCVVLWFWYTFGKKLPLFSNGRKTPQLAETRVRWWHLPLRIVIVLAVVALCLTGWFSWSVQASRLPDRIPMTGNMMDNMTGGMTGHNMQHSQQNDVSVTSLVGPQSGEPNERFTLVAQEAQMRLSSGATVNAWTFNGQFPGPELRVHQGDLVEVKLINKLPKEGVTLHWHGLDVPNAEDGVAGVTQNAVQPGESFTYRFVVKNQPGTYWYHSHQASQEAVEKGLFGALIVLPRDDSFTGKDIPVLAHSWPTKEGSYQQAFDTFDTLKRLAVQLGTPVRLRLINTDSLPINFVLSGTSFKVIAIDGTDLHAPTELTRQRLLVAAGGRYDIQFTMPDTAVSLDWLQKSSKVGLLLSRDGTGNAPALADGPVFNPATYGSPQQTPFSLSSHFDKEFSLVLDDMIGFYDGKMQSVWPINGKVFPNTPMLMVHEGDLVKVSFVNRSWMDHPMHLHGHHMLVLSYNGRPVTGSPWWVDTLNIAPGESYEVAFRADNLGI